MTVTGASPGTDSPTRLLDKTGRLPAPYLRANILRGYVTRRCRADRARLSRGIPRRRDAGYLVHDRSSMRVVPHPGPGEGRREGPVLQRGDPGASAAVCWPRSCRGCPRRIRAGGVSHHELHREISRLPGGPSGAREGRYENNVSRGLVRSLNHLHPLNHTVRFEGMTG